MCTTTTTATFIGPDFIGQLAERQLHAGLEIDAQALQLNEKAWREDRAKLDQQERELDELRTGMAAIQRGASVIADAAGKAAHA